MHSKKSESVKFFNRVREMSLLQQEDHLASRFSVKHVDPKDYPGPLSVFVRRTLTLSHCHLVSSQFGSARGGAPGEIFY